MESAATAALKLYRSAKTKEAKDLAFSRLLATVEPMLRRISYKHRIPNLDYDDQYQIVIMALHKIAEGKLAYDPSRGALEPFLSVVATRHLWNARHFQLGQRKNPLDGKRVFSVNYRVGNDELIHEEITLPEILPTEIAEDHQDLRKFIKDFRAYLSKGERQVFDCLAKRTLKEDRRISYSDLVSTLGEDYNRKKIDNTLIRVRYKARQFRAGNLQARAAEKAEAIATAKATKELALTVGI